MNIQNSIALTHEEKPMFLNPMIRRISEIKESDKEVSTYGGIFVKFVYFMLMIIAGIALALTIKSFNGIGVLPGTDELHVAKYAIIGILASFGIFLLFPLIAFAIRKTIPVIGALYCVATGYILGFILALETEFNGYMLLAMVLTFSLVFAMGFLYFKGYIRVTNKFRAITVTLFSTMIISSSAMLICYFIPALRGSVVMLRGNVGISIAASVVGVIIACMFLLIDFETIRETVENRLPKQYEWFAAFGFLFTVVWLYFKVLDLVSKVKSAST